MHRARFAIISDNKRTVLPIPYLRVMGYPIRVSPEITAELKSMVETILQRGRIPEGKERAEIDAAIEGLGQGFDINVRVLLNVVSEYGTIYERKRGKEFGDSIKGLKRSSKRFFGSSGDFWEYDLSKFRDSPAFAHQFPRKGMLATGTAISRAKDAGNPLLHDPSELITYVFEPLGSFTAAKDTPVSKKGGTAFDWIQSVLGAGIATSFREVIRGEADELRIPPTPSSPEFYRLMKDELGLDGTLFAGWRGTDYWQLAMAYLFADLLVNGTVASDARVAGQDRARAYVEIRNESIAQKALWLENLLVHNFDMPFLERAIMDHFDEGSNERTHALAELSRFHPLPKQRPWEFINAAEIFLGNMHAVHRMAPDLEGNAFTKLLVPLSRPLDFKGVKALLKDLPDDPKGFKKFKALNIFGWHTEAPERLTAWLSKLILQNKKYDSFEKFLSSMYDVTVDDFVAKAGSLRRNGADVSGLLAAVGRSFPGAVDGCAEAVYAFPEDSTAAPIFSAVEKPKAKDSAAAQMKLSEIPRSANKEVAKASDGDGGFGGVIRGKTPPPEEEGMSPEEIAVEQQALIHSGGVAVVANGTQLVLPIKPLLK